MMERNNIKFSNNNRGIVALSCICAFLVSLTVVLAFASHTAEAEARDLEVMETVVVETTVATPTPTSTPTPTPSPSPTPTPTCTPTPTPLPTPFPGQGTFKSYENYRNITNTSSPQYKLQQQAYTGDYGIRMVDGRYCVAMGSYWATEIGTKLDVYLESGEVIYVILGDNKQNCHTDSSNRVGSGNKDVLEFIVDVNEIPSKVKNCGNFNCIFSGKVVDVQINYDDYNE